jgi:hypothetical protein
MKFTWLLILIASMLLFAPGCGDDDDDDSSSSAPDGASDDDDDAVVDDDDDATGPQLSEPEIIVPSPAISAIFDLQQANNNLDVVEHEGRTYLAWRSGPTHFASRKVRIFVASTADGARWDFEAEFHLNRDLREPRLLSFDGMLFLYFALLGANPLDFEPGGEMVTQRAGPADWTEPIALYEDGFLAWRTKTIDGVPYMLGYIGGESVYDPASEGGIEVHWLTTDDGYDWQPVIDGQPVVLTGGSTETDFVFLDDGSLVAVARTEAADPLGFGSKLCSAPADDLGNWECVIDPKKYDSPLMFKHENQAYIIGRRNLSETGNFDLGYDQYPEFLRYLLYELDYWLRPKRTSLWTVDAQTLAVDWVLDFPSTGDTCFPGILQGESENEFVVYNYSSPWDGGEKFWLQGQLGPTVIYRTGLSF